MAGSARSELSQQVRVGFEHLWQQKQLSDIQLVLQVVLTSSSADHRGGTVCSNSKALSINRAEKAGSNAVTVLKSFPAHKALLSASPYFAAQIQRWQDSRDASQTATATLRLDSAEDVSAALAVLATLYGVAADLGLPDEQLLRIVLLSDRLQVTALQQSALQHLLEAVASKCCLSSRAERLLVQQPILPQCLMAEFPWIATHMPLQDAAAIWGRSVVMPSDSLSSLDAVLAAPHSNYMQQLLLKKLGDLEEAWWDAQLREVLLALPLPAMLLLLCSDKLKVSTEDTVLYTAQAYTDTLTGDANQQAQQQLAPLIRCPYLSAFWLTAVIRAEEDLMVLSPLRKQCGELLAYRQMQQNTEFEANDFARWAASPPSSWLLGRRAHRPPAASVNVTWHLPGVQFLRACMEAIRNKKKVVMYSPATSAPMHGVTFQLRLDFDWVCSSGKAGLQVSTYIGPQSIPDSMFCSFSATVKAVGYPGVSQPLQKQGVVMGPISKGGALGRQDLLSPDTFGPAAWRSGWSTEVDEATFQAVVAARVAQAEEQPPEPIELSATCVMPPSC